MMRLPAVAAFELTYRCNHRCLFCSCPWETDHYAKQEEMDTDECCRVLDVLRAHGVETVSFTGGEPLLRADLFDLMQRARAIGLAVAVVSNGRLMDAERLAKLQELDASVSVSVPGIATYEQHTGVDGLEHVLGLFRTGAALGLPMTANIAVTRLNLPELYENIAYPLLAGAQHILLNRFLVGGRGYAHADLTLDRAQVNQMLDGAEEVLRKAGRFGHVGTELPLCLMDHPEAYEHLQVSTTCGAAKGFCDIDPSGWVKVCNHSERRLVRWDHIDNLANNDYWLRFVNRDYRPRMCAGCMRQGICDGGCREAAHLCGGDICSPDPCFAQ